MGESSKWTNCSGTREELDVASINSYLGQQAAMNPTNFCPECGQKPSPAARFCWKCGCSLTEAMILAVWIRRTSARLGWPQSRIRATNPSAASRSATEPFQHRQQSRRVNRRPSDAERRVLPRMSANVASCRLTAAKRHRTQSRSK